MDKTILEVKKNSDGRIWLLLVDAGMPILGGCGVQVELTMDEVKRLITGLQHTLSKEVT